MTRCELAGGAVGGLLSSICACSALAGAISVAPIRVELSAAHPVATVEVRNDGDSTATIQLEKLAWSQTQGKDVYETTAALIATPTVFSLAPHGRQVLRVALRDSEWNRQPAAYRLYVTEVLDEQQAAGSGLQMALRLGIPVFAVPHGADAKLEGALFTQADGSTAVVLRNSGRRFTRALGIAACDSTGAVLWRTQNAAYLLAQGEHAWSVDEASSPSVQHAAQRLMVSTDGGSREIELPSSPETR
jgi:fimbrial chaperone protein